MTFGLYPNWKKSLQDMKESPEITRQKTTMKKWVYLLCSMWLTMNAASAMAACTPLPGAEQLWSKAGVRWVLVGELHGSNETPAAFLDLVCDALALGRRVTVALERPTSEQADLEGILAAKDLSTAREALLSQRVWKDVLDGRGSDAMLSLLLGLRELRRGYPELSVAAFDAPFASDAPGARDEAMGRALLALENKEPKNLILIFTGNVHVMRAPMFGYDFAAMYLPVQESLSLEVTDVGGESWSESDGACGVLHGGVGNKGVTKPRGVFLDPSLAPYGKVDGILSLGVALTASAPAVGEPSPPPTCRIKYLQKFH